MSTALGHFYVKIGLEKSVIMEMLLILFWEFFL